MKFLNFDDVLNYVKSYDNIGTLYIMKYGKNTYLKERLFISVEVEWNTIYGPLTTNEISQLYELGIVNR